MRILLDKRRDREATIRRREQTGTNGIGEPLYDRSVLAEDVPCRFTPAQTDLAREDPGERVERSPTVAFDATVDIREGDTVDVAGESTTFEARQVQRIEDTRRSRVVESIAELDRVD